MNLSIANVINISVSQPGAGLGKYNTSNLALITTDDPVAPFALGYKLYLEPSEVETDFGTASDTYKMALSIFGQQPNILANGGYLCVIPKLNLETLAAAITRTKSLIQYFGIVSNLVETQVDMLAAAAVVQTENKILFVGSRTIGDIAVAGKLDLLRTGSYSHTRGLYYGAPTDLEVVLFMAAYAGRGLSVNFSGSNTTLTMHLKDLIGVQPDPTIDQTGLNQAKLAGADTYISIQGVPKVFCSGANQFFDDVYNLLWFVGDLQIAGFNLLAQVGTKIAQTEDGVTSLKGAYRNVCEQAGVNQFIAAGKWTSPTTFGNQEDLYANISQRGYYIYSQPVSQQSAADREARKAPLIQIAIKYAGAIHSSDVIVNVNK
jgi:hypothetical protein